jgi:hypothetical protein
MKMFRWLMAGGLVILLAALVLSRTGRVQPVQSPQPSPAESLAGRESAASAVGSTATVGSTPASKTPAVIDVPHSSINAFENWARAFVQGDGAQRAALLEKVGEMATARRAEMAALIRANPQEALHRALPYSLRQQLPAHVLLQIEQPVSARGLFRSVCYKPFHAGEDEAHDLGYEVIINGTRY